MNRSIPFVLLLITANVEAAPEQTSAELRLAKGYLASVIEKLPPRPFEKADKYKGTVHTFRLGAIDPQSRQVRVSCQIEGDFHARLSGPITNRVARNPSTPDGWRHFRFEVSARVNVEPGAEGIPRFKIDIDEVKRKELDGVSGLLASALGGIFDDLVTQIADGRASRLSGKLNEEIARRVGIFQDFGILQSVDYQPDALTVRFDVTRLRAEGITGYVFAQPQAGTVPLYRWFHPVDKSHLYTINPGPPPRPKYVAEGVACHVFDQPGSNTRPVYHGSNGSDHLYGEREEIRRAKAHNYQPLGVAFHVFAQPQPGTVPLYRFFDPLHRQHFYTTHQHAEFAK
jgi:hypothetical protein